MMAVDDDGLWVHSKFGLSVPRRNGKSEVDKMRELWGVFHGEHILHTAHRTAKHSAWIFTNVPLTGEDVIIAFMRQLSDNISIHVPLAGDDFLSDLSIPFVGISIHVPPCGGRRSDATDIIVDLAISIHVPLAGDDQKFPAQAFPRSAISIHVPLAGDDLHIQNRRQAVEISIHVPLAGDDSGLYRTPPQITSFLSTSPLRGTTEQFNTTVSTNGISIHVPLAGDDTPPGVIIDH